MVCIAAGAHLPMPDDHLHFCDVDRPLPELRTFAPQ
jgi:hypothetical protein